MSKFYVSDRWSDTAGHFIRRYDCGYGYYSKPAIQLDSPATDYKRAYESTRTYPCHFYGFLVAHQVKISGDIIVIEGYFGAYHGYDNTRANFGFAIVPSNYIDNDTTPPSKIIVIWTMSRFGWGNGSYGHYAYVKLKINPDNTVSILEASPGNPSVGYANPYDLIGQEVSVLFGYSDSWTADWNQWACARKDSYIDLPTAVAYTQEVSDAFKGLDILSRTAKVTKIYSDTYKGGDWVGLGRYLKLTDYGKPLDYTSKTPLKAVSELAIPCDRLTKGFIISLFERVFGEHWGVGYRGKILRDSFKGLDVLRKMASMVRTFADSGKMLDYTSKGLAVRKIELLISSDKLSKTPSHVEHDYTAVIDYTSKTPSLMEEDAVRSADVLRVAPIKALHDIGKLTEYTAKSSVKCLSDFAKALEILSKTPLLAWSDLIKGVDAFTSFASFLRTLYDAGKTSEYTVKNPSKRLADTGKTMDILKKSTSLLRSDYIKSIDYMCKLPSLKELDTIKGIDTHTIAPTKILYELSIPCDRLSKSLGKSLLDRVFGEWVYETLRGKVFRDTVKAVEVFSKTTVLHREYFDAFIGSDRMLKEFVKPVSDLFRTSDRLYKSILKVFEAESSIVGVPFKEMAREARDTVKALEVLFTKDIVWDFIEKVVAKERPRKEVLAYFFDTLSTEYVMAKGLPRVVREAVKGVDIASKELATSFSDLFKVKDLGAFRVFIKEAFERIFSEHDYVRSSVKVYRDYSRFTDPIAKIAFTLTQLWTRRVYSRPEKFADIIEASDHNVRVDACKKLLDKIKKLKEKLESM